MRKTFILLSTAAAAMALALSASAQGQGQGHGKGQGQGHGQGQGQGQGVGQGQGQGRGQGVGQGQSQGTVVIADRDRTTVYNYYRGQYAAGNCPPGLAKKNNGCLPPGQANKVWALGQPLPPGIVYYPLPGPLLGQLTPPPPGYEYVQVANDILLMAIGTRMIAGALADLSSF